LRAPTLFEKCKGQGIGTRHQGPETAKGLGTWDSGLGNGNGNDRMRHTAVWRNWVSWGRDRDQAPGTRQRQRRSPGVNEKSRLSDVQIQNANAANYYECARMKEKKQQSLFGKRLPDFGSVPNGSQWYSMVLNGIEWCSTVSNGTQWLRMVSNGAAWFRPSGQSRQDRERECGEESGFARTKREEERNRLRAQDLEISTPLGIVANCCEPTRPGKRARPGLPGGGRQAGKSLRLGPGNTGWHASAARLPSGGGQGGGQAEAWHQRATGNR